MGLPSPGLRERVVTSTGIPVQDRVKLCWEITTKKVATGTDGKAAVTLTLGPNSGENKVTASVVNLSPATFTVIGLVPKLEKVSGDGTYAVNEYVDLVVLVKDQFSDPMSGVTVNFQSTGGDLSSNTVTTEANGEAVVTLTVATGTNTVTASVAGITPVTFTVIGQSSPTYLQKVSPVDGPYCEDRPLNLVVLVRDQNSSPMSGVEVNFNRDEGNDRLSATTAQTDANGKAEVALAIARGTNTITASVTGIPRRVTFVITGVVCGDVSGDGIVSPYDASLIIKYLAGLPTPTPIQPQIADVSGNGVVTSYDAALIFQIITGLIK